ncbi:patatin-like phospholipase family protein [Halalkalibacterium halodurans]|uniref:patatin-like phospholipase family protein n=1 Tax=Halalkalibacterium halodurans TaxID=86665 RepID=UPI002AAA60EE|nr:patatin-like phospholipase family protein [Halalkalibacterium halodurans]MDY7223358.1 patatin-like phospholipase family protein [Halalkalibacterium halodurans]MDY7242579.1 patatin-like phospholipase family protein [Halalkalibacterium halodurans]
MNVDGVFAGGGVKAFAFIGALQVLEENGFSFTRVAGTSAGAIFASLVCSGYRSDELFSIMEQLDGKMFKDGGKAMPFPFAKWLRLYFKLGMYKGDQLEKWLIQVLGHKGVSTFADLPKGALKIVASDISRGRLIVLPDDLKDYGLIPERFSVARAVRMSCGIPYFFQPVKLYNRKRRGERSYVVDGGILSNFPIWLFHNRKKQPLKRPVIGFQLTPGLEEMAPHLINNAVDLYQSLFDTMIRAHDLRYIAKDHAKNIVFIPVQSVKATDFDLDEAQKKALVQLGREETLQFLSTWS